MYKTSLTIIALTLCMIAFSAVFQAKAHSWYDAACCNTYDCEPVDQHVVRPVEGGWLVTIKPGDHRFAKVEGQYLIPYNDPRARQAKDDQFHVCMNSYVTPEGKQRIICIYVPDMGV